MKEVILQTKNLTKKYGKQTVLDHMDIQIHKGDIYGLVGKNGAGKTTLMRIVTGLMIQNEGELELFGATYSDDLDKARKRTGMIIETPSFFPYLSARKNLEYYRLQRGIAGTSCVDEALKLVGLDHVGSKKFKGFSLGMKQRLGLALAIMGNPDFLILDEPINGLDPSGIIEFREILLKLNRERQVTILISSHILSELAQLATTYGFIHEGKLIEQVSSKEIEERCKHHLLVKVDNTKKAVTVLEEQLACTEYEIQNSNEIKIFKYLENPEVVVATFVKEGLMVQAIGQVGMQLENYFMDLIGGEQHA